MLRIAVLQHEGVSGSGEENLAVLRRSAREAAASGAALLVTPEMFVTGYNIDVERLAELAQAPLDHEVRAIARDAGIAIAAGLPYPVVGGLSNSVVVVGADGAMLCRYDKTHLFGELDRRLFQAGGATPQLFELGGVRVAVLVCYDVEFPETVRGAALQGADLVIVPTAQMAPFEFVAEHLIRVRAWENQTYVAYADRVGDEGDLHYVGRSSIVDPEGVVLAGAGPDDAALLIADIDADAVRAARFRNPYLLDRRTDLYPSPTLTRKVSP